MTNTGTSPRSRSKKRPARKLHHRTVMGRAQRERTRAKILDAANTVFANQGSYPPVIDDFVAAAGIARGTFYYYFSTVEQVRAAAVRVAVHEFAAYIEAQIGKIDNPVIRFATAARMYLRRARTDTAFAVLMSSIPMGTVADEYARKDIRQAMKLGLMRIQDVNTACTVALAVVQYAARYVLLHESKALRSAEVIRSVLLAWGVEEVLIEEALASPLPKQKYRPLS